MRPMLVPSEPCPEGRGLPQMPSLRPVHQRAFSTRCLLAPLLVGFLTLVSAPVVAAQDWAKAMFDHTTHNFGMVARGAKVEHRFTFENIYLEDARIKSISSSCSCTTIQVQSASGKSYQKSPIKTYDELAVVATLNTRKYTGRKDATIRVVFDKPFPAEVQLHVHSYIRTDVVLTPGAVRFGEVIEGDAAHKQIILSHAGSADWKITSIQNEDPHLNVGIETLTASTGQSSYQLDFSLKPTAPPGYIRRHVTLLTNDPNKDARRILVPIEGLVTPSVSIHPSPLALGPMTPGTRISRNLVVQSRVAPFKINELSGPDDRFALSPNKPLGTATKLHLIAVTFTAGTTPGKIDGEILVRTDIAGGRVLRVQATGEVMPASSRPLAAATPSDGLPEVETTTDDGWHRAKN